MQIGPRLRTATTLVVLSILMLLGLVWGWSQLIAPLPSLTGDTPTPEAVCTVTTLTKGTKLRASDVTVSVYNAGVTDGLANRTIKQFGARGFSPGDSGNAPATAKVDRVQVWAPDRANPAVQLVLRHLGPGVKVTASTGEPLGPGIVVVVGDDFTRVLKGPQAINVRADAEVCVAN
ncbi:LytR C-terminal domain-containing protein [Nocardioides sp.]|uniref:LytR C-terminal domain-containing protein n=1 Tax=Nocardioides sp. TaxID=35761 RepID=UPI003D116498